MVIAPTPSVTGVAGLTVLLLGAPIIPGVIGRTKAIFAGRRGPPVWQLYADLWKLARRGIVYSTTTTWMFRLAPIVLVATTVAAAALLPLDGRRSTLSFAGDAVAFAYLLALGRFALVLAALDTGSSFEGMGASREAAFASLAELGLFTALAALGIMAHDFSLSQMLGKAASSPPTAASSSAIVLAISVFVLALAECSRVPVDDPATHLELTMIHEVMVLDHSGPDLAMIMYAAALKLALFAGIVLGIVIQARPPGPAGWLGVAALVGAFIVLGVAIGIVESVMARLRLIKVPLYLAAGSSLALFGLILQLT